MRTNKSYPNTVHISAVWNYNPVEDITEFYVMLYKSVDKQSKENIDKWLGYDITNGIKCKEFHKTIPLKRCLIY